MRITTETANGKIISPLRLDVLYDFVKTHLSVRSQSPGIKRRALTIQKGELAIFQEQRNQPSPNPSLPRSNPFPEAKT